MGWESQREELSCSEVFNIHISMFYQPLNLSSVPEIQGTPHSVSAVSFPFGQVSFSSPWLPALTGYSQVTIISL